MAAIRSPGRQPKFRIMASAARAAMPRGGAPPSGVDCRGHLLPGVAQQHRDTVGGKDGQTQAGGPGDQAVGLYSTGRARGGEHIGPGDQADQIPVDLMIFHQSVRVRPHSAAEAAGNSPPHAPAGRRRRPQGSASPTAGETPPPGWKSRLESRPPSHGGAGIKRTPWRSYRVISMDVPPLHRIGVIVVMW